MENSTSTNQDISQDLLQRFLAYCRIGTTSDRNSSSKPSTPQQMVFLQKLDAELSSMAVKDRKLYPQGYLVARIPGQGGEIWKKSEPLALLAHVDTSPDAPGMVVNPIVHENYSGKSITLSSEVVLDPTLHPLLNHYKGTTLITSDGTSLLGADDKAGVAEIMTAVWFWQNNPQVCHAPLEIIFTTDEEIGRGTEGFPLQDIQSKAALTLDGSAEGGLEWECYNAWQAKITFRGISAHPGSARGLMVNAVSMAAQFVSSLPRNESPESTDGRFGCLWANHLQGTIGEAEIMVYLRDFEQEGIKRRIEFLHHLARTLELAYPGGSCKVETQEQYANMREGVMAHPHLIATLRQAFRRVGLTPSETPIRGGTDGSRLTELGLPTPNIFTGGMNYHSLTEWASLKAMVKAVEVVLELGKIWATMAAN